MPSRVTGSTLFVMLEDRPYTSAGSIVRANPDTSASSSSCLSVEMVYSFANRDLTHWYEGDANHMCIPRGDLYYLGTRYTSAMGSAANGWRDQLTSTSGWTHVCDNSSRSCRNR